MGRPEAPMKPRRNLRPLFLHLRQAAGALAAEALEGRTDEEVADLLIGLADRILVGEAIPVGGPLIELITDGRLRLIRPRVVQRMAAFRARRAALRSL